MARPVVAFALEAGLLFGGMLLYLRSTSVVSKLGRYGMPAFGIVLLAVQAVVFFGSPPSSPSAAALTAILSYVVFAAIAYWLETKRQ